MYANLNVINWYRSTCHLYLTLVSQIFHGPPFGYTLSTSDSDDLNITCSGMMILCWLKDRSWRWYLISLSRDRALPKPWGHPEIGDLKPIFAYFCRRHFRVMCVYHYPRMYPFTSKIGKGQFVLTMWSTTICLWCFVCDTYATRWRPNFLPMISTGGGTKLRLLQLVSVPAWFTLL